VGKLGSAIELLLSVDLSPRNLLKMPFPGGLGGVVDGGGLLSGTGGMGLGGGATSFLIVSFVGGLGGFLEEFR
jgi:hypothetical protein